MHSIHTDTREKVQNLNFYIPETIENEAFNVLCRTQTPL